MQIETPPTPEWFERNKGNIELGGASRGGRKVFMLKYTHCYQLLQEAGIIDDGHVSTLVRSMTARMAHNSPVDMQLMNYDDMRRGTDTGEDATGADLWRDIERRLSDDAMGYLQTAMNAIKFREEAKAETMRYLYAQAIDYQHAIEWAQEVIEAFDGKKEVL